MYRAVGGASEVGRRTQFDWAKDNYAAIKDYYGNLISSYMDDILYPFAHDANNLDDLTELRDFVLTNEADLAPAIPSLLAAADNAEINIFWMDNFSEEVVQWLTDAGTN